MNETKSLSERLDTRISKEDKDKFLAKCADLHRTPQSLVREMVIAVSDGRLKMKVTEQQLNNQQEIYDVN